MKTFIRSWAVIFLAVGLQVSGCTSDATEPADWQASLSEIAKTELSDASAKHDTLTASWAGELSTLNNLPFASTLTLAEVKHGFSSTPTVRQTAYARVPCLEVSAGKNRVYWIDNQLLIGGEIQESYRLLNHVQIGMQKADFFRLFFKTYPPYMDKINTIEFYTGMADNSTCYTFKGDELSEIKYVNVPD
ncbi:MAG: hypothetical protein EOO61_09650 [Hymenobacter sp.]|nr:MAG: hypothetical protein EOO61_09650 [Hymenobacter sp.]